uniref:ARAD1C24112p n=1 Tax=Blastobotrys adeninivorans TaxID=409370 RepID=A0A060T7R6_BLAAD
MSNDLVGDLYYNVINGVINESRQDFEDSGVDEATLQELRLIWQQRLSSLGVATMPWDNIGMPGMTTALGSGPTTASNIVKPEPDYSSLGVKKEPDLIDSSTTAALRAAQEAQNLAQEHRSALVPGVDDGAYNGTNSNSNGNGGGLVFPGGGHLSQTDGAADSLPLTTEQVDKIVAHKLKTASDRELQGSNIEITLSTDQLRRILQTDGASDQSDEINSDLDDSEDEIDSANEDEDDDGGMIMLCLYDKVQRVKNKWKYVLKDGVANINGKDYVFSRGSGESEW